jgi:hypothetical protein
MHGNTGDGINISVAATSVIGRLLLIQNANITANGGYGINAHAGQIAYQLGIDFNNFGTGATANTSGARNNLNAGANDLAVDPQYTNAATGNFTPSGTNLKGKSFPLSTRNLGANQSTTVNTSYVGVAEPAAAGAAGVIFQPDMAGGCVG